MLYALRQEVGDRVFREIEREWAARFGGEPGVDGGLHRARVARGAPRPAAFLRAWLYGTRTPPMPGHPDWKVDAVPAAAAAPRAALGGGIASRRALRP